MLDNLNQGSWSLHFSSCEVGISTINNLTQKVISKTKRYFKVFGLMYVVSDKWPISLHYGSEGSVPGRPKGNKNDQWKSLDRESEILDSGPDAPLKMGAAFIPNLCHLPCPPFRVTTRVQMRLCAWEGLWSTEVAPASSYLWINEYSNHNHYYI